MHPIIVLDGPDAVGKTSLALNIMKKLDNCKYVHCTYRFKDKIFDYHTAVMRMATRWAQKQPVIIDRWWPSEACYATVYRKSSSWPLQGRFHERVTLKYGVIFVMCLPDNNTLSRFERLKTERDEMYDDIKDLCALYLKLYYGSEEHEDNGNYIDQMILSGGMSLMPYYIPYTIERWGSHNVHFIAMILEVADHMQREQIKEALNPDEHNFLGHKKFARYLFVGEQVNPKYRNTFWPFFEYGNCSLYFTQAIHELWIREHECAYTNVKDHKGNIDLKFIEELEDEVEIIAMGNIAQETLSKHDIEFQAIKHPQYYRRFNGKGYDQIKQDIKEALWSA